MTRTCLVVDDDPAVRTYVETIMARRHFETLQAEDGVKGLRLAQEMGVALDLIVTDIEMPGGDGLTFITTLRLSLPAIPVIMISGIDLPDGVHRPVCEFVPKPFSPKMLLDALDRTLLTLGPSEAGPQNGGGPATS
ncbi:MAG TPA: response regulator [Bryobacteraceae bacterium]|nr:response regulator [Bryobacteraceae bacterium]